MVLILLRVPISIAIGAATLMTFLTSEFSTFLQIIPQQMLEGVNKASLTAVPFFIMAGNLMNVTGVTQRIFDFANALVGHLKAGLAQVNILASMIFAGISGAAVADCAGLGSIEIKAMRERGYKPDFAATQRAEFLSRHGAHVAPFKNDPSLDDFGRRRRQQIHQRHHRDALA